MHPLLRLFGLSIPSYILINSLITCVAIAWIFRRARPKARKKVLDLTTAACVGGFLGARLFHILYENPGYYSRDLWRVFQIWRGGFVFYGGVIGATIAVCIAARRWHVNPLSFGDLIAPVIAWSEGTGRIGCLLAGCCYGRPALGVSWASVFPPGVEAPAGIPLYPTQWIGAVAGWALAAFLIFWERRFCKGNRVPGSVFGMWLVGYGISRWVIEQFRGDFRGPEILHWSISMWLSAIALCVGVCLCIRSYYKSASSSSTLTA